MDSRSKILPPERAAELIGRWGGCTLVSGYFDPLLLSQARRLESIRSAGTPLAVLVREPANPDSAGRARAELVAALESVELVIVDEAGSTGLPEPSFRFETQDDEDALAFAAHVRERQA